MPDPFYLDSLRRITQAAPNMPLADRQRLASMGRFAQQEGVDIGMYGDRDAEGYGAMLEDLDARQPKPAPAQPAQPAQQPAQRPMRQAAFATPVSQGVPIFPQQSLQGMANSVMNAWSSELDSRVSQNREQRRMAHEKELERMRQEAALKKIAAEQDLMKMKLLADDAARRGDNSKRFVPGRGFVPSWMT